MTKLVPHEKPERGTLEYYLQQDEDAFNLQAPAQGTPRRTTWEAARTTREAAALNQTESGQIKRWAITVIITVIYYTWMVGGHNDWW